MLRLSLRLAQRSSTRTTTRTQSVVRCFGSRTIHEGWMDERDLDDGSNGIEEPTLSADDMELYHYDPNAILDKLPSPEEMEAEQKRKERIRNELDSRTGRLWTDPWEITDEEWAAPTEYDDLPDWTPASASKFSLERVQVLEGGVPSLGDLAKIPLPPPPHPHPSSEHAREYAAYRRECQYKYILSRVSVTTEPKVKEIMKLPTWEDKQDAIDELFETVEVALKDQEMILGRHPSFGAWVERALEEYLESVASSSEASADEKPAGEGIKNDAIDEEPLTDEKAVPIFIDLYDKSEEPEKEGSAPIVPKILHPLAPHPKGKSGRMVEEWELAAHRKTRRIMLRQSTREIAQCMEKNNSFRIFVTGAKGVGKTAALLTIVASARKTGHIVLFAPDGDRLRKHGYYIEPNTKIKGLFDLPMLSQELCGDLLESHSKDMEGMKAAEETKLKYLPDDLVRRLPAEYADELSLVKLLELAKLEVMFAPMCYSIVVETLMNQDEKPFLVVLDEYNCYYDYGHYFHMDYDENVVDPIPLDQINLFKPFMDCMGINRDPDDLQVPVPIKRGGIIVSMTENKAVIQLATQGLKDSAMKAAKEVDQECPLHVVTIPRFSALEVEHVLSNFDVIGIGRLRFDRGSTVLDPQEVAFLRMASQGNGQLLLDSCIL